MPSAVCLSIFITPALFDYIVEKKVERLASCNIFFFQRLNAGGGAAPAESAAFGRAEQQNMGRLLRPEGPPGRADGPARAGSLRLPRAAPHILLPSLRPVPTEPAAGRAASI